MSKKKKPFKIIFHADGGKDMCRVTVCDKIIYLPLEHLHARITVLCVGKKGMVRRTYEKMIESIEVIYDEEGNFLKAEKVVFT